MPIITQCPSCGKKLRAPDQQEGKQAKCPQCKKPFVITAIAVAAATGAGGGSTVAGQSSVSDTSSLVGGSAASGQPVRQSPQPNARPQAKPHPQQRPQPHPQQPAEPQPSQYPDQWYVQTGEGAEYGPVTYAELQQWVVEDRIDAECQILQDGWDQWKWAEDVFAELGGAGPVADNPFAAIAETPAIGGSGPFAPAAVGGDANPYAAPQAAGGPITTASDDGAITPAIVRAMQETKPWVMLFGILAFIVCGILGLAAIGGVILMTRAFVPGLLLTLMYGVMAVIYGYFGYLLVTYSNRAGGFVRTRKVSELEKALVAQKDFWKIGGILMIVVFVIGIVGSISLFLMLGAIAGTISN